MEGQNIRLLCRGPVVDNAALLEVLKMRADLSVVLDVWEPEPDLSTSSSAALSTTGPRQALIRMVLGFSAISNAASA
jgi:lactate dehydrogenase-like 2-hydroxyacid dehydrogenase